MFKKLTERIRIYIREIIKEYLDDINLELKLYDKARDYTTALTKSIICDYIKHTDEEISKAINYCTNYIDEAVDKNDNIQVPIFTEYNEIPEYQTVGSACIDLVSRSITYDEEHKAFIYGTGIHTEIPKGYMGMLLTRSSTYKTEAYMMPHVGVIDSDYRGEIKAIFKNKSNNIKQAPFGLNERIAQFCIVKIPNISFNSVNSLEDLSPTERGSKGFGSTGK